MKSRLHSVVVLFLTIIVVLMTSTRLPADTGMCGVAYFGTRRIRYITHADLERFKGDHLARPVKIRRRIGDEWIEETRERSVSDCNRHLSLLRSMLNLAKRSGWIIKSPFEQGPSLISPADEVKRERILTPEEEERLLAFCVGRRAHLRPILICALDTAMRIGEIRQLRWSDIDLVSGLINVRAFTTKTLRSRKVGITKRLRSELEGIAREAAPGDELVFGISNNIKHSFCSARKAAGIEDFRFHDTRYTATTRMIAAGMPIGEVMKITGHTTPAMLWRYLNADAGTASRMAEALDQLQARQKKYHVEMIN
jgi:integrase